MQAPVLLDGRSRVHITSLAGMSGPEVLARGLTEEMKRGLRTAGSGCYAVNIPASLSASSGWNATRSTILRPRPGRTATALKRPVSCTPSVCSDGGRMVASDILTAARYASSFWSRSSTRTCRCL